MDVKECLLTRKSIRNFSTKKVPDKIIKDIINIGTYAPNACNFQAWKFIILRKQENKNLFYNHIINNSDVSILVTYRNDIGVTGRKYYDYIQSAAASIMNMLLYIHSIGLAACWVCHFPKKISIKKQLKIPKNFSLIGVIALGYPNNIENKSYEIKQHYKDLNSYKERKRKYNLEQVLCEEQFKIVDGDCFKTKYPKNNLIFKIKELLKETSLWKKI